MGGNNFPHDGEHGRSCTGGRKSSGGGGGAWVAIAIVVIGSIVGAMNELIGAILIIVPGFIFIMCR